MAKIKTPNAAKPKAPAAEAKAPIEVPTTTLGLRNLLRTLNAVERTEVRRKFNAIKKQERKERSRISSGQ